MKTTVSQWINDFDIPVKIQNILLGTTGNDNGRSVSFTIIEDITLKQWCSRYMASELNYKAFDKLRTDTIINQTQTVIFGGKKAIDGNELLEDLLNEQKEVITSVIRFNGVHIEKIKQVFEKHGIKYDEPF